MAPARNCKSLVCILTFGWRIAGVTKGGYMGRTTVCVILALVLPLYFVEPRAELWVGQPLVSKRSRPVARRWRAKTHNLAFG
eukprot:6214529-Pleurochrysis_carterae.AAC.2